MRDVFYRRKLLRSYNGCNCRAFVKQCLVFCIRQVLGKQIPKLKKIMRYLLLILFSFSIYGETSKILCELDGTYSVTYKDIKKTYLSEGIELFKNLAKQTQQSLFLLQRAKTNFAEEDWQKDKICLLYTSPSPRDRQKSRMPSSA